MTDWRLLAILFCLCFGAGGIAQYSLPSLGFLGAEPAAPAAPASVAAVPTATPAPAPVQLSAPAPAIAPQAVPVPVAAPAMTPTRIVVESRPVTPVAGVVQPVLQPAAMSVPPQALEAPRQASLAAHAQPPINPQNRDRRNREFVRNCTDHTLAALHRNAVSVPRPRVDVLCRCFAHHRLEVVQASLERSVALDAMTNAVGVINARGPAPRVGYLYLTEFAVAERHCPWMRGASMASEQSTRDPAPPAQPPRPVQRRAAEPHEAPRVLPVRLSAEQRN